MLEPVRKALQEEIQNRKNTQLMIVDGYADFIFLNQKGAPMYASSYSAMFSAMVKKYNKHHKEKLPAITPHTMRHTFCTNMANKGMDIKTLQYLMGHSNASVTLDVYTHSSFDSVERAFEQIASNL